MSAQTVLVVEDNPATSRMVSMALKSNGYAVSAALSLSAGLKLLEKSTFDLILSDLYLGDGTALDLLSRLKSEEAPPPLVVFTAQGSVETAVEAIEKGAFDYLAKPFQIDELLELVRRGLDSGQTSETEELPSDPPSLLIGTSPPMVELYKRIALAARSDSPVLLSGETGTGKELVARSLHLFGSRRDQPFLAVNCGALTETLLESELFGHEKGAFTGALSSRKGLFLEAQGGTLFLDEISETSPAMQVRLLRVLQEAEVRPVGASRSHKLDVRVIAATNRAPGELLEGEEFRTDLFYRLSVIQLEVPPLRQRKEDLPQLVQHFLAEAAQKAGRRIQINSTAMLRLSAYSWPGNVRELENVIQRAAVFTTRSTIEAEDLDLPRESSDHSEDPETADLNELDRVERGRIIQALRESRGNRAEASRRLGIERKSLYRKARRLGIELDQFS